MMAEQMMYVVDEAEWALLRGRWEELLEAEPKLRIRDAAARLGVGETQLLATQVGSEGVVRLRPDFKGLFEAFETLGEVMVSTRNAHVIIEKTGTFRGVDIGEHVGLVLDEEIDLRLFMAHFHSVFAVEREHRGKPLRSVQLFDKSGESLHKVYLEGASHLAAYEALVTQFRHEDQGPREPRYALMPPKAERADAEVDVASFQESWLNLQDTHDFFGMLRKYDVKREQALRLAPEGYAKRVALETPARLLHEAAERELPIMVFVGSRGCIEIHTGPVRKVVELGDWLNVLDPRFSLHFDRRGMASVWQVKKPTVDGVVTSFEVFDAGGELLAMYFGKRKPGIPEDERWRELAAELSEDV